MARKVPAQPVELPQDLSALLELSAIQPGQHPRKEDLVQAPPRQLPDEDDPAKQPMPERDPRDPQPVEDPDNPPPEDLPPDQDSGPVDQRRPPDDEPDDDEPEEDEPAEDEEDEKKRGADDPSIIEPDEIVPPSPSGGRPSPAAQSVSGNANVVYESRIQILDAFQYPGNLKEAPAWVDRNWVAYAADYDQLRQIEPGPCLRVPLSSGVNAICRVGDFVCRQEVILSPGLPADIRVEVWERSQFEKLFVPTRASPPDSAGGDAFVPTRPTDRSGPSRREGPEEPAMQAFMSSQQRSPDLADASPGGALFA
jgi:hypothetical protein